MNDFLEEMKRKQAALDAADAEAKAKGTLIGRYLQYQVADGYAYYVIKSMNKIRAQIEWVDIGDGYVVQIWGKKANIPLKQARQFIGQRDALAQIFQRTDDWWTQQKVGAVVHYDNGFQQYVRGVIAEENGEKKMRATALVGSGWRHTDICTRRADGSLNYNYNARMVVTGELMQPNASNMVEYPEHHLRGEDPRKLSPISLEPPPMMAAQKKLAGVALLHGAVMKALAFESSIDPEVQATAMRDALRRAKRLLKEID